MPQPVKVGIIKVGCIGTLPLIEILLDERADRKDIDVRVVGSGAKLGVEQCREVTELMIKQAPEMAILIGPAQAAPGPTESRRLLREAGIPTIVISDGPAKKITKDLEKDGFGYIIVEADSMIGARREFLDPTEMAIYNADVIRVLAATGSLMLIVEEIDKVIDAIKNGKKPDLPRVLITKELVASRFKNPYAAAKASAAYEIARHVAEINVEACFKVREWTMYTHLAATGHEMMRIAAKLADEAREIEKGIDSVLRKPHFKDGRLGEKSSLIEKPKKPDASSQ
ncbi:F420-dependent methylenetetrahydromethanopterin dehydrogenase [Candidatus Bathyarchaeota archaeon]|nr:MAG: F420-dependent methylenetetrahydromethanopterin dehydrogenase [Candidatus Bathyarchaeota archaeon]